MVLFLGVVILVVATHQQVVFRIEHLLRLLDR